MITSDSISKLAPALLIAQKSIKFAKKDAKNPFFKSTYADLESVINSVKQSLNDADIIFIQSFSPSRDGFLNLTTRLIHTSGEWIQDELVMPLKQHDAQGFGSAATYARRYALAAFTGLYQADDDGNLASQPSHSDQLYAAKTFDDLRHVFADVWLESGKDVKLQELYESLKLKFKGAK